MTLAAGDGCRRRAIAFGLLLLLAACRSLQERPLFPGDLLIVHTNDVHGNVRALPATWVKSETTVWAGGSASLATFLGRARGAAPGRVLLLDAGDVFQGTPEGNETRGRLMIEVMNRLDYDAAAAGNHEFDYGVRNFAELIEASEFAWMAENLVETRSGRRPPELTGPKIIERGGIKVGVFGLTTEDLEKVTNLSEDSPWRVRREIPAALEAARELRRRGADIVVMVSHIGLRHDSAVAAAAAKERVGERGLRPLIDLIVGGHSHTRIDTPLLVGGIPIVQAGSRGTMVGAVRLHWNRELRRIDSLRYRVSDLLHSEYPPDSGMAAFLEPHFAEIDRVMNEPVGLALGTITRGDRGHGSTPMGNLQTDILREAAGTEIGFANKGGIRADILSGPVRLRDLYQVSPFGNTIVVMRLTGAEVSEILAHSLSGGYTPLEISGVTVYCDTSLPEGRQLVRVTRDGGILEPERVYSIATNSFLGAGGDGYPQFKKGRDFRDTGRSVLDAEIAWFRAHPDGVAPNPERRWRSVDEP